METGDLISAKSIGKGGNEENSKIESMEVGKKEEVMNTEDKLSEERCLLFLGTFYHDNHKEHNLDLIQYKVPVRIQEIRVIPLGATVNLSNGSFQLGATNPSELELEFYYNDLQNPSKSTFAVLERFKYSEKRSIQCLLSDDREIFTDGILVRGLYSSLTVATYGHQVDRDKIKIICEEVLKTPDVVPSATDSAINEAPNGSSKEVIENSKQAVLNVSAESNDESGPRDFSIKIEEKEAIAITIPEEIPQAIPTITTRFSISPVKPQPSQFESMILEEEKIERISSEEEHFDDTQDMEIDEQDTFSSSKNTNMLPPFIETEDISDEEINCEPRDEFDDAESTENDKSNELSKFNISADSISRSIKDGSTISGEDKDEKEDLFVIDSSHELLSDQDDSFGEDFSEYVEQISDAELDDYGEDEMDDWDDFCIQKPNVDYNPLSSSFEVSPLKKISIESFVIKPTKQDKLVHHQVMHNLKRFSKTSFNEHMIESWVTALEHVLTILPDALGYIENEATDCMEILGFWVKTGIDLNLAKTHTSHFIVRHLKAGLKLTHILCCYGGSFLDIALSVDGSLCWALINILKEDLLKTSIIQRLIYKILDSLLDSQRGWVEFTSPGRDGRNCVDELQNFVQQTVEPRCSILIKNLQAKIYLASRCKSIYEFATNIAAQKELNPSNWNLGLVQFRLGMDELKLRAVEYLRDGGVLGGSVIEDLSTHTLFENDSKIGFIRLLREHSFIKSLEIILHHPLFVITDSFAYCLMQILQYLMKWGIGLVYLCSEGESTKHVLMKLAKYSRCHEIPIMDIISTLCLELQLIKDIDNLVDIPKTPEESEEDNNSLKRMHSLLSTGPGREALVKIFSQDDQILSLLKIIRESDSPVILNDKTHRMIYSCRKGYAIPLFVHVVKFSDSCEFLKRNGAVIHEMISSLSDDFEGLDKLKELLPFLKQTLDQNNFTHEGIESLCQLLETNVAEDFLAGPRSADNNFGFTPEILTVLRIFNGLAIYDDDNSGYCANEDSVKSAKQLECARNYIEMNSKDVVTTFVKMLKKIASEFDQPYFLKVNLVGPKGDALVSMLIPLIRLLQKLLTEIVEARVSDYKDLEPVEALIHVYGTLKYFPETSKSFQKVKELLFHIVETIGTCAIVLSNLKAGEESEEQLKNCMWTRAVAAIFKFILNMPCNVKPGMELLLDLMPNAFPVITKNSLSSADEHNININQRRWGVYMHGVTEEVQEVLGTYCITNDPELFKQLCTFCTKLASLSASTCLLICRTIMDKVLASIENDCDNSKVECPNVSTASINAWVQTSYDRRIIYCSLETTSSLRFLSYLTKSSSRIKTGIMYVGRASSKLDEKYAPFIGLLCNILTSFPGEADKNSSHYKGQQYVISIFQSFCDINNNVFSKQNPTTTEQILSNSLPIKENFGFISAALLSFLQSEEVMSLKHEEIVQTLFISLGVLSDTDYGFHHLKVAVQNQSNQIYHFLAKLVKISTKAVGVVSHLFIDFIYSLINTKDCNGKWTSTRQSKLQPFELRKYLTWDKNTEEQHYLEQLLTILEQLKFEDGNSQIDQGNSHSVKQLGDIIKYIKKDDPEYLVKTEVILPPPDAFSDLFIQQSLTIVLDSERETLFELNMTDSDELLKENLENKQLETLPVDLPELSQSVLKLDLLEMLNSIYDTKDLCTAPGSRNISTLEVKPAPLEDFKNFKPPGVGFGLLGVSTRKPITYHISSRGSNRGGFGRGMSRGANSHGGSHFDPFRSRPPNTSRPPSLHVDDFVAMESSTGPNPPIRTGIGMRSMPSGQDQFVGRGRGNRDSRPFDSDRGRSFRQSSQVGSPYYPRSGNDQNMTRGRGRGRGWSDSRNSPIRGNYSGRQEQSSRNINYSNDNSFRNSSASTATRSVSSGIGSSSSIGPIRNSPGGRYTRQPYREAPPSNKGPSSSSAPWREKSRSTYNR